MALHPLKSAAVLLLTAGTIAAGLSATVGQESTRKPATAEAAERQVSQRRFEASEARFEAMAAESRYLRLRVEELERRLEAIEGLKTATRPVGLDQASLVRIRPRFDNVLIRRVFVHVGQVVRKGDPLLEFSSPDLTTAKHDCWTRFVQWDHDRKFLVAREPLAKEGRITQLVWTDTQNDERKSRLDYLVARDKLVTLGMTGEQIDKLLERLIDDRKKVPEADDIQDLSSLTVSSPIDGVVMGRNVVENNFYDMKDVLLILAPPSRVAPPRP